MKPGALVAAVTASGILGGVVGALLVQGPSSHPAPAGTGAASVEAPARDEALGKEVADLRARIEEMQGAVAASSQDATKLRADLERERKASAAARTRLESLEKGEGRKDGGDVILPPGVEMGAVPLQLGKFAVEGGVAGSAINARLKKTLELMRKPEDERWTAIREALSLSSGQEDELKAAIKERDLAMRDLTKVETHEVTGPDGSTTTAMTVAHPDPEKVKDVHRKYDDRVNANLTADQAKKWRDDGYESAAGGGGAMVFTSVTTTLDDR